MLRVVAELQVDVREVDRRLASHRVARDVEVVRRVLDVDVAAEEHRVVQRGRELADAAAVVLAESVLDEDRRLHVALLRRARPELVVQRERLARVRRRCC